MNSLLDKTACEQAKLLAQGEISSLELTDLYLSRSIALNESLNAFTYLAKRSARAAARKWDKQHLQGKHTKTPLSGIPTGIKDLHFVRGMPTRFGTRALPPIVGAADSEVTKRVRAAGMIVCGKLSTSEFGCMPVTETDTHKPTRNAYNQDYTAGGSSGGSGAAVSAGMLPIAQGSDGAGSIRIPAAVNHLVGLKPSRGLISPTSPVDAQLRLSSLGGLARSVEDLSAFLDSLTDWPNDFYKSHRAPLPRGLKVGLVTESEVSPVATEYKRAAEKVAKILEDCGAKIVPTDHISISLEEFLVLWKRLFANAPMLMEKRLQPVTHWLREAGKKIPIEDATAARIRHQRTILDWFDGMHLCVSPTLAIKTPRIGAWRDPDPETSFRSIIGMGAFTAPFNVSGQPAVSVPLGFCEEGLPIGVQIAGRPGDDAMVLQAARVVEEAVGGFRTKLPV